MGFADLHIHSIHSYDGTASISAILKFIATHTDLNVIALTDHDTLSGVDQAARLAPEYGLEVIPGCEISTADGHLLALFIHKAIPARLSLAETVLRVRDQGGLCVVAHPAAMGVNGASFSCIRKTLDVAGVSDTLVGVEAFNGGLIMTHRNPDVERQSGLLPLAQTGNSDSHILDTIGQGSTQFEGSTALELRQALLNHSTRVRKLVTLSSPAVVTRYLPRIYLRKMGWVIDNIHAGAPFVYAPLSEAMEHNYNIPHKALSFR